MSGVQIVILVWLIVLTVIVFFMAKVVAVLARQELLRDASMDQAKKMLRWGLEQRKAAGAQTGDPGNG